MVHTRNSDGTSRDDSGFTPLQVFNEIEAELFGQLLAAAVLCGLAAGVAYGVWRWLA